MAPGSTERGGDGRSMGSSGIKLSQGLMRALSLARVAVMAAAMRVLMLSRSGRWEGIS